MTERVVPFRGNHRDLRFPPPSKLYDADARTFMAPPMPDWFAKSMIYSLEHLATSMGTAVLRVAVLDTGVISTHPVMLRCLEQAVDMTSEGPEDLDGHGTGVALIAVGASLSPIRILSCKVLGHRSGPSALAAGLRWVARTPVDVVNLSVGVPRTHPCDGSCEVCVAAMEAITSGRLITAAAGHEPGQVVCPATTVRSCAIVSYPDDKVGAQVHTEIFGTPVSPLPLPVFLEYGLIPDLERAGDLAAWGRYDDAISEYRRLVRASLDSTTRAAAAFNLGLMHKSFREFDEAKQAFRVASACEDVEMAERARRELGEL
jgi:hypothetical protein